MSLQKTLLYSGKAKSIYKAEDAHQVLVEFRDDTTAFDGTKKAQLAHKGIINNYINAFIMETLEKAGVATHLIKRVSDNEILAKSLDMIRVECVVRNLCAGNLARRLGVEEGLDLSPPVYELFLKNDELHDPVINESIACTFGWASEAELQVMKQKSLQINSILRPLFANAGMILVDYKLEFGRLGNQIVLGDEFTPDSCRIWDMATQKKLDKDRFRRDLGNVIESYLEVAERLGIKLPVTVSTL